MKYIVTALILMAFTGCGSDDNKEKKEVTIEDVHQQEVIKESVPLNAKKEKTPPAIPQI